MSEVSVDVSFGEDVTHLTKLPLYHTDNLERIAGHVLTYITTHVVGRSIMLPNFIFEEAFSDADWVDFAKSLDIYICGVDEGRALNLEARGKDYATNILSYPSHLPSSVAKLIGRIPLGELILCHEVLTQEACEQGKSTDAHLTHLIIHGILHLLGFDHELGQAEQDEMEGFEIAILTTLGIANPYE